ncbi:mitochondrial antiviral-signaling protein [Polypterus senegalus]|uniref:mitochondrial antiviral-signaling protein n=1 Tax=Polypterus senegalus TaxID=55291 RepID=UPI0019630A0D|nr:mitochondrial antiviral-signaling protein [Polypterus senegalus]
MSFANDKVYSEYMRPNLALYVRRVRPREILRHLPCLSDSEKGEITANYTQNGDESGMELLITLLKRKQNWATNFIYALRETGHIDLADEMQFQYDKYSKPSGQCKTAAPAHPSTASAVSSPPPSLSSAEYSEQNYHSMPSLIIQKNPLRNNFTEESRINENLEVPQSIQPSSVPSPSTLCYPVLPVPNDSFQHTLISSADSVQLSVQMDPSFAPDFSNPTFGIDAAVQTSIPPNQSQQLYCPDRVNPCASGNTENLNFTDAILRPDPEKRQNPYGKSSSSKPLQVVHSTLDVLCPSNDESSRNHITNLPASKLLHSTEPKMAIQETVSKDKTPTATSSTIQNQKMTENISQTVHQIKEDAPRIPQCHFSTTHAAACGERAENIFEEEHYSKPGMLRSELFPNLSEEPSSAYSGDSVRLEISNVSSDSEETTVENNPEENHYIFRSLLDSSPCQSMLEDGPFNRNQHYNDPNSSWPSPFGNVLYRGTPPEENTYSSISSLRVNEVKFSEEPINDQVSAANEVSAARACSNTRNDYWSADRSMPNVSASTEKKKDDVTRPSNHYVTLAVLIGAMAVSVFIWKKMHK